MTKWFLINKKGDYKLISKKIGVSNIIGKLLVNRGITTEKGINIFMHPDFSRMHDAGMMKGAKEAVSILAKSIKEKSKIRVIGDYDVDGVISTYILVTALKRCGGDVDYDIPDRIKDGYGINMDIIDRAKSAGVDTIITCDNGIAAASAVKHAKDLEMTIIVTDHHDIPFNEDKDGNKHFIIPEADVVIDPKQNDCNYDFKGLCGAGVAFKLMGLLYRKFNIAKEEYYKLSEYAAIATVCDVVDIVDENRIIVKNGIELINNTENLGLSALIRKNKIEDKKIATYHIGFIIGPCINASGRLESAKKALKLLLCKDKKEAETLAEELYNLNSERKEMTSNGLDEAINQIESTTLKDDKVLVVYIKDVHESVAGIIAGRIKEKYNRPSIVLTKGEEGVKGSGRSIEKYNMFYELTKCKDLFEKFGGHKMAAGMSLKEENIDVLRKRLNKNTDLSSDDLIPEMHLDMRLPLDSINYDLIYDLDSLEPYGKANPKPIFGEKNINAKSARILGKNHNVLKIDLLTQRGNNINGIYFGDIDIFEKTITEKYGSAELNKLYKGFDNNVMLDIVFYPNINEYNGNKYMQVVIESMR
ncbi:MAG: single-stranded-DNA-specific exonuclease RecJ [Clostridium sp.]|nr:single-stranded-DNA-specific exonuclease RecJ [Clostridium sp.]